MADVDLERLVLPALLTLLILGAFTILVTSGGGERTAIPAEPAMTSGSTGTTAGATSTSAGGRFARVRSGDTPTSIAQRSGISVERLLELNPSVDPARLRPGQSLKIVR